MAHLRQELAKLLALKDASGVDTTVDATAEVPPATTAERGVGVAGVVQAVMSQMRQAAAKSESEVASLRQELRSLKQADEAGAQTEEVASLRQELETLKDAKPGAAQTTSTDELASLRARLQANASTIAKLEAALEESKAKAVVASEARRKELDDMAAVHETATSDLRAAHMAEAMRAEETIATLTRGLGADQQQMEEAHQVSMG